MKKRRCHKLIKIAKRKQVKWISLLPKEKEVIQIEAPELQDAQYRDQQICRDYTILPIFRIRNLANFRPQNNDLI